MTRLPEKRLEASEERELAQRLIDLEKVVGTLLAKVPACRRGLQPPNKGRVGGTRAAAVDRLRRF